MSKRRTFIDLCLAGEAFLDEIDDYVDEWHESETTQKIWRFLGMTRDEYALWVERPESLRVIVDAHRRQVSVADLLSTQRQPMAARADHPDDAEKLIRWLERTGRLT